MPVYRGIAITLHSQFNIDIFPEFPARPQAFYAERGIAKKVPELFDEASSTANVFVPVFPGSQFWIAYAVRPPVPEDQQFFFKLFINGAHIVSWATGKDEDWKGKTMFALYERDDGDGKKRVEKRALCFTPPDGGYGQEWTDIVDPFDESAMIEIRVFRAHGKKRVERNVVQFEKSEYAKQVRGVNLVNAGRAGAEHPKRFYKVALIDPTDKPFATFRYYYRTWNQLYQLELVDEESDFGGTELSIIEPETVEGGNNEVKGQDALCVENDIGDGPSTPHRNQVDSAHRTSEQAGDQEPQRLSYECTPPRFHNNRPCAPPPVQIESSKHSPRRLLAMEKKDVVAEQTSHQAQVDYPVDEWTVRTPSPIKSLREGISTPPLTSRSSLSASGIISAIANTWRRRGAASSESSVNGGSRNASRNGSRNASR
ncbi:hypothetical protein DM02DRAFT_669400 [Periconia macrospinosa]|uniref:DUF7918 domain-containing protein n=1 Tax=Periconia macrospinosa TaxID=97972 RepID=A0A2V1E0I8_9PLEO|nr:hypothetical protein DM02DRAFT_669400 [Periconia macrospinosa]